VSKKKQDVDIVVGLVRVEEEADRHGVGIEPLGQKLRKVEVPLGGPDGVHGREGRGPVIALVPLLVLRSGVEREEGIRADSPDERRHLPAEERAVDVLELAVSMPEPVQVLVGNPDAVRRRLLLGLPNLREALPGHRPVVGALVVVRVHGQVNGVPRIDETRERARGVKVVIGVSPDAQNRRVSPLLDPLRPHVHLPGIVRSSP
jgi:hypothetical protein